MKKKVTYFKLIDNKNIKVIKKDILKESTNNTNTTTKTDIINKNDISNSITNKTTNKTNAITNVSNTIRTKKNISNNITGTFLNNIPFHKKILNTSITVDYFKLIVLDSSYNYLSHYHSDHYLGMNKKYKGRIVVSETTGNLIERNLLSNNKIKNKGNIKKEGNINIINDNLSVIKLKMYTWYKFTDHLVYLIDAKHCPGAVCFLFFTDRFYLHTGDFRCSEDWYKDIVFEWYVKDNVKYYFSEEEINLFYKFINQSNPYTNTTNTNCNITTNTNCNTINTNCNITNNPLSYSNMNINCNITNIIFDKIYLDNTFENVKDFPSQKDTIIQIIKEIKRRKNTVIPLNYKYLFISYSVGKEKVFMSVCKYFNMKINVRKYKKNNLECFTDQSVKILEEEINKILNNKSKSDWWNELLTQDESEAYVISLSDLKIDRIIKLFNCKRVLVIFPTGWAKKNKIIRKGDYVVEILYFRYSEHSSHSELTRFKECMNGEIVNTVKNKWRGY